MPLSQHFDAQFRTVFPARPLGVTRIVVGLAAVAKGLYLAVVVAPKVTGDALLFPFFQGAPEPSIGMLGVVLAVWIAAAAAFAVGWHHRLAGSLLLASVLFFVGLDQQFYSNHTYLLGILVLLLTIADSAGALSIDARHAPLQAAVDGWPVTLLRLQLSIVYGYAVVAKLNPEFLSGMVIYESWMQQGLLPLPEPLRRWEFLFPLAIGATAVELFLAFAFWSARLIRFALPLGVALHLFCILTVGGVVELSIFSAMMFSLYLLFLPSTDRVAASAVTAVVPATEELLR